MVWFAIGLAMVGTLKDCTTTMMGHAAKAQKQTISYGWKLGDALSRDVLYLHSFDEIKESFRMADLTIEKTETFLPAKDFGMNLLISIQGKKDVRFG